MPSALAFSELIDSMLNIVDEGFDKTAADGLKVAQLNQGKLLSFYQNIDIKSPIWSVQLDGPEGGLTFGNGANANVLTLRQLKVERDGEVSDGDFELEMAGRLVADGRRGRAGRLSVPADGCWHNITDRLKGCNAFEIMAGVGKPNSGKYALMHAFAIMAFNGKSEIDYRQAHFGSKCNRLQLQWVPDPDGARHAYILQMRVGCSYDNDRNTREKTWVSYYLTNPVVRPVNARVCQGSGIEGNVMNNSVSKNAALAEPEAMQILLTAEQGSLMIAALAECPFRLVYELIGKLNYQVNGQLNSQLNSQLNEQANNTSGRSKGMAGKYACALTADELKLILHALGNLPYHQAHALIHALQQQWQAEVDACRRSVRKTS